MRFGPAAVVEEDARHEECLTLRSSPNVADSADRKAERHAEADLSKRLVVDLCSP
jgi:hypothetical protein